MIEASGRSLAAVLRPGRLVGPETLGDYDLVLVLVPQEGVDWDALESGARAILDCCNAFGKKTDKIVRL